VRPTMLQRRVEMMVRRNIPLLMMTRLTEESRHDFDDTRLRGKKGQDRS